VRAASAPRPSAFGALLVRWNGLDAAGFAAWELLPGMRFGERAAWWRDGADRGSPHEGLDLRLYRNRDGRLLPLVPGSRVPAVYAGEVVSIVEDFLGSSVFLAHAELDERGRRLHTVYGHVAPRPGLAVGCALSEGDQVGTVADAAGRRTAVPPHLHLTLALIAREGGPATLDWAALRDPARALLLDPLPLLATA
jgi:murein DD-endopeptidase MepM/ murein hydrolase activator NlpD